MSTGKAFAKITDNFKFRGQDALGSGAFGAPRSNGKRKHAGVDVVTTTGQNILAPIAGTVTRFPIAYPDDTRWVGIEIKNDKYHVKMFYMKATVKAGVFVKKGDVIGVAQNLNIKYPAITNHVHFEVVDAKTGKIINPTNLF